MRRSRTVLYLIFTDWMILVGTFAVALHFRHFDSDMNIISRHHLIPEMSAVILYTFTMLGVFSALGLYKRKIRLNPLQHLTGIIKAVSITVPLYLLTKVILKSDLFIPSRWVLLQWGALLFITLCVHRLFVLRLLTTLLSKTDMRRRVVVIGDTPLAQQFINDCRRKPSCAMNIIGLMEDSEKSEFVTSIPSLGTPKALPDIVNTYKL